MRQAQSLARRVVRPGTFVAIVVASVLVGAGTTRADLGTGFNFRGSVRDPRGAALAGVTVTDGLNTTTTASDGTYTLHEGSTGSYTLSAFRADMSTDTENVTVLVPLDTTQDFSLVYRITGGVAVSNISTAAGPASVSLTITAYAPNPGNAGSPSGTSCVTLTDTMNAPVTVASLVRANPDGSSTFSATFHLDRGTGEAPSPVSFASTDCASGLILSSTGKTGYVVDNLGPIIDATSLVPGDDTNTAYLAQPLLAKITDTVSGVDATSISFALSDVTAGTTVTYTASAVSYNAATSWAKTTPASLVLGHNYRFGVSARDRAGNSNSIAQTTTTGPGFLAIAAQPSVTNVRIPTTPCGLDGKPDLQGMQLATCPDVPAVYAPTQFGLTGTQHSGTGHVKQTVSLAGATLSNSLGLTPEDAAHYCVQGCGSQSDPMYFLVTTPTAVAQTLTVPSESTIIGTVKFKVPAIWPDANISMTPTTSSAANVTCPDPTASAVACTPDPVAFDEHRYALPAGATAPEVTPGGDTYTWSQPAGQSPAPSARSDLAMAFDRTRHNTVAFGGFDDNFTRLADTWTWDGKTWTLKCTSCGPEPRLGGAMALDPQGNIVLFGGTGLASYLSGTWIWDGTRWTQRFPTNHPSARTGAAMAYDSFDGGPNGETILFGGYGGSDPNNPTFLNDTWAWDGTNWHQLLLISSLPAPRESMSMAYDSSRGEVVMFGGYGCAAASNLCGDTWLYSANGGSSWTQETWCSNSPTRRYAANLVYAEHSSRSVLFAGYTPMGSNNEVWLWPGTLPQGCWTQVAQPPVGSSPVARMAAGMAYDSGHNAAVLFGGFARNGGATRLGDTWHLGSAGESLNYHDGSVIKYPKVYITYWGWQDGDPATERPYLENFHKGVGGSRWLGTVTQYYDRFAGNITNPSNILLNTWVDTTTPRPAGLASVPVPCLLFPPPPGCPPYTVHNTEGDLGAQIATEARNSVAHFGYSQDAIYLIAMPHLSENGINDGFAFTPRGVLANHYCAWHFFTPTSAGQRVAYENFPYISDAGSLCFATTSGPLDGVSLVAGHELVEALTDPGPNGWYDRTGLSLGEAGDKCVKTPLQQLQFRNITVSTGTFPVEPFWSNKALYGTGGCVLVQ